MKELNLSYPKVCILTSVHSLYDIRIFYKQAKSLLQSGHEVTLVVPDEDMEERMIEGVCLKPVPKPRDRLERLTSTLWRVWREAVKAKADIYHFHDPELIFVGILLRLQGHKVIYDIHENVVNQIRSKRWVPLRKVVSSVYRLIELSLCRFFVLVLAEASYNKLYPNTWKKIVVQNFPELCLFPQLPEERFPSHRLVYLGGVTRLRGISVILEALSLLKQDGVSFHFDCIGDASTYYMEELEQECARLDLGRHVIFHGRMKATEAYKIVSQSAVGLAVLQPNSNYLESFPTKMFEYMALQVPVVTSDFPLYRRTVEAAACGINVNPEDPIQLAQAIRYLFEHPEEARKMGVNGRHAVETKYNWSMEEAKLLMLYRELKFTKKVVGP
jgi:glycosyltransferase involved in cell wall biosynthesis